MPTKKNTQSEKPGRIQITETRTPGRVSKKTDLFANIHLRHPIDEMFNPLPPESKDESVESSLPEVSLDSQITEIGNPNIPNLEIQSNLIGNPNNNILDFQADQKGLSKIDKIGYPKPENLDSLIAKEPKRIAKKAETLDSNISELKNLDSQTELEKGKWDKYDAKRQKKGIFLRTEDSITKKFKQFCIRNEWDFAQGTEIAWNKLMIELDSQKGDDLAIKLSHDDRRLMLTSRTTPLLINLYLAYNSFFNPKTRWTVKDDESAYKYNDVDIRIIELGIIQTHFNRGFKKGKINSFGYYTGEIDLLLEEGFSLKEESLVQMMEMSRKQWSRAAKHELDLSFLKVKEEEPKK